VSAERVHAQEQPAPCASALMRGEHGGDPFDDERHREVVADVERHRPARASTPRTTSHEVQRDVEAFHAALDIPTHDTPGIRRPELRAALIREEADETVAAILAGDLIEALDGCCDLLAVVYGTAAEFGVDLAPFWDEVHRTNMAKVGGPVRADGKRLKPPGWTPPDLQRVLDEVAAA
jgi:predicted HAD superfamily Cof-like phosphohydrolase